MPARDSILVVDDTVESLRLLVDTLEREEMSVLVARSGEEALELLAHAVPDLILMDGMMPGLSGLETTQRIKAVPAWAHIPIIFMTGITDPDHLVAALRTGGVDYVRKPVVIDELLARIRVHLGNARQSHRSRLALDTAGANVVALDPLGAVLWSTPETEALLARVEPGWSREAGRLPDALAAPVGRLLREQVASPRIELAGFAVELSVLESEDPRQTLIRLSEIREGADLELLQKKHGLTRREAEVLLWVSYGKSNRTISDILSISPRTVNKHLEQVFRKLGVETRAAAAAQAVRAVSG